VFSFASIVYQGVPTRLTLSFAKFVIDPIYAVFNSVFENREERLKQICAVIHANYDEIDWKLPHKQFFHSLMRIWMPLGMLGAYAISSICIALNV
jgi:hypothetical protein